MHNFAPLVARAAGAWSHGTPYAAAYVKPYVKRQKKDATYAEAICEAATRPNMRFVETKTTEQQSVLVLRRTRQLFMKGKHR